MKRLLVLFGLCVALPASAAEGVLSPHVFTGLWLLQEPLLGRTSHPLLGGGAEWTPWSHFGFSGQVRLTYDREGTDTVLQQSFLGALDIDVNARWELGTGNELGVGVGASGYLTLESMRFFGSAAPASVTLQAGPMARVFVRAPLSPRVRLALNLGVADRSGKWDGLLLAGVLF